jgi:uncharacterized protein (TIGR04255 family)
VQSNVNYKKYQHAPLVMAVVDISFSELPNFEGNFNPEKLAESLFALNFTQKATIVQNGFEVQVRNEPQNTSINSSNTTTKKFSTSHWVYLNNDRTLALHIMNSKLILKCTKYDCFTTFKDLLERCIEVCETEIPHFDTVPVQKVGMRYVDLIIPKHNQDLKSYLNEEWHSPTNFEQTPSTRKLMMSRTTQILDDGEIKVRVDCAQFEPKNGMPISVIPNDLSDSDESSMQLFFTPWMEESLNAQKNYVILDIDASLQGNLNCPPKKALDKLESLRLSVRSSFNACITEKAENEWEIL